jgi:hypothetical protein
VWLNKYSIKLVSLNQWQKTKQTLFHTHFPFGDCGSFAGPGGSGPPAQLQKATTSSGLTIDNAVANLAIFSGFIL